MSKITLKTLTNTPDAPSNGEYSVYFKNGELYKLDHNAVETKIGGGITIPDLDLKVQSELIAGVSTPKLYGRWTTDNEAFLALNPQVWMFRKRRKVKKLNVPSPQGGTKRRKKGYIHPTDSARPYDRNAFLQGSQSVRGNVANGGELKPEHRTEWDLPNTNGQWFEIPLVPGHWLSIMDTSGSWHPYTQRSAQAIIIENGLGGFKASGVKNGRIGNPKLQRMRFAITIDNPNATLGNQLYPKIIGNYSMEVLLRFNELNTLTGEVDYSYFLNEVILSFSAIRDIANL